MNVDIAADIASAVLAKAAAYDPTFVRPDPVVLAAWAEALGDKIDKPDALEAVAEHYRAESRRLMPSDVVQRCKIWRRRRLERQQEADTWKEIEANRRGDGSSGPPATVERIREIRRQAIAELAARKGLPVDIDEPLPDEPVEAS